jgi:hypothetical protein
VLLRCRCLRRCSAGCSGSATPRKLASAAVPNDGALGRVRPIRENMPAADGTGSAMGTNSASGSVHRFLSRCAVFERYRGHYWASRVIRGSRSFIFRENESTPKSQSHSMFVTSQVRSKSCVSVCSDCERQHDRRDNRCYSNVTARLCDKVKTPSEVKSIDNINQLGCYLRFLYLVWLTSLTIYDGNG